MSDKQVYLFYAGVLEYMITDILKLTVSYIENFSVLSKELTEQDVKIAMFADKVSNILLIVYFQNVYVCDACQTRVNNIYHSDCSSPLNQPSVNVYELERTKY